MAAVAVVVLLALAYWVAKPANETVTVVPSRDDGHIGTVVVQRGSERRVVNQAHATTRTGDAATITAATQIRDAFGPALRAMPAQPTIFTLYFITGTDELTDESKADL